ncbi:MAG: hypothetical protein P4L43_01930 [Syntrophobacteraceae bacterium]|nr:hypothetical protein [Syntrophobacteraceae bacterium]
MPGIFGIIAKELPEERSAQLHQMLCSMRHEPGYRWGIFVNEPLGLRLGWTAHKGSFCESMPVWNEKKDVCLIFSGEDFRDPCEILHLRSRGHACRPDDAGYLVHLYEEKGPGFLETLNGWFSGILADFSRRLVILFNDRYGLGRIYYHQKGEGFYFSSEAKALLRALPELREVDLSSLAQTFSMGCVVGNRTLFPKIYLLPPASRWSFDFSSAPKKETYFHPGEWENQPLLGDEEYYGKLQETFARILPRYLREPVAMSLTGGLDGRLIMARADWRSVNLPCYTFGGLYRDCADVKIARRVAKLCGQSHETIRVGPSFFSQFPELSEKTVYVSDGAMDVSGAVELFVNRIAARLCPVRLTGNYGSEILRRHVAFKPGRPLEAMFSPEFAELVRKGSEIYEEERRGHKLTFIAFKQTPWHNLGRLSVEQSQLTMRSPFLENDLVSLAYQAPASLAQSSELSLRLIADGCERLGKIPTDRGLSYRPLPVVSEVLHAFREFSYKAEYAYDYGMPQWLAAVDHVVSPLRLERLFLGRQKFYHFRVWYRRELSRYAMEVLLDPQSLARPYIDGKGLSEVVNAHVKGIRNYTGEIHAALTAELIQRCLIERT